MHRDEGNAAAADAEAVVIGGGLAGCEAAWQLTRRGVPVRLYEMRPARPTAAHRTDKLGELVCSNSFRNDSMETAVGVLKREMRRLGSLVIEVAERCRVPAGAALAVDRERFADGIAAALAAAPKLTIVRRELERIPAGPTVVATGPLTSPALAAHLQSALGEQHLYFYDAIAPIVAAESIDPAVTFRASRYDKGGDDYVNCPMTREEYYAFVDALLAAEQVPVREFERCVYFEGCMPIEEMARRGRDSLAFGPMRPVGLVDPRNARRPHAVVQLRQDDAQGTLYNMVGFQTKMTHPEQRRVFRMIPGLERAEFVRLGSLHRNTFVNSPRVLAPTLRLRGAADTYLAGQLTGVEGYVESAATGLLAGINLARRLAGLSEVTPPPATALGSLLAYVTDRARRDFQPMNANYGLFPPWRGRERGREKRVRLGERALAELDAWMAANGIAGGERGPAEERGRAV